jgi:hypothetical protein
MGLGLEKRFVQKKDSLEYYLVQVLIPQLTWFLCSLQEICWDHFLQRVDDFELLQMRDEFRTWLMRLEIMRQYRDRLPSDYPRWDLNIQEIFYSLSVPDQELVFVCWLAALSSCFRN